jgi:hypothetical protein
MVTLLIPLRISWNNLANAFILDSDVKNLSDAIWTHKIVVVKGQKNLAPSKQWELVTRFDPDAPQVHSHGDMKTFKKEGGVLAVSSTSLCRSTKRVTSHKERAKSLMLSVVQII